MILAYEKTVSVILNHLGHETDFALDGTVCIKKYKNSIYNDSKFGLVIIDLTIAGGMVREKTQKN